MLTPPRRAALKKPFVLALNRRTCVPATNRYRARLTTRLMIGNSQTAGFFIAKMAWRLGIRQSPLQDSSSSLSHLPRGIPEIAESRQAGRDAPALSGATLADSHKVYSWHR